MRIAVGVLFVLGFAAQGANADTIYKYKDKATGRDVFVNRIDQIPRRYRTQAKVVLESTAPTGTQTETENATDTAPAAEPPPPPTPAAPAPRKSYGRLADDIRRAASGKQILKEAPAIACAVIDAKLLQAGTQPLTPAERSSFASLFVTVLVFWSIAGVVAVLVWFIIIVGALRDTHPWWALLVFLFWPLAYVYLFVYAGKNRAVFKTLCSLGLLSPALVGLVAAWRFTAWFHAVVQARGGRL
jgi:hypothetical protein